MHIYNPKETWSWHDYLRAEAKNVKIIFPFVHISAVTSGAVPYPLKNYVIGRPLVCDTVGDCFGRIRCNQSSLTVGESLSHHSLPTHATTLFPRPLPAEAVLPSFMELRGALAQSLSLTDKNCGVSWWERWRIPCMCAREPKGEGFVSKWPERYNLSLQSDKRSGFRFERMTSSFQAICFWEEGNESWRKNNQKYGHSRTNLIYASSESTLANNGLLAYDHT